MKSKEPIHDLNSHNVKDWVNKNLNIPIGKILSEMGKPDITLKSLNLKSYILIEIFNYLQNRISLDGDFKFQHQLLNFEE